MNEDGGVVNGEESPYNHETPFPVVSSSTPLHGRYEASFVTDDSEQAAQVDTTPIAIEAAPKTAEIPTEAPALVDKVTRRIADAINLAIIESTPLIKKIVREVVYEMKKEERAEEIRETAPEIEYNHRQHVIKLVGQLSIFIIAFALTTYLFVWLSGNILAAAYAVVILILLLSLSRWLARRVEKSIHDDASRKKVKRLTRTALFIVNVLLYAGFLIILEPMGVSSYWSAAYLAASTVMLYFALRQRYMWAEMYITRDGGVLVAHRPEKGIFFLPTLSRELILNNVNECDSAQSWIEERLGIYRVLITLDADMPVRGTDAASKQTYRNAMFWRNMKFIVDGRKLRDAIKQGSMARRR